MKGLILKRHQRGKSEAASINGCAHDIFPVTIYLECLIRSGTRVQVLYVGDLKIYLLEFLRYSDAYALLLWDNIC